MTKILYVSSAVQAILMTEVFIVELTEGSFWKNHRPAGHGDVWRDVEVKVSDDGNLGPVGFTPARNYNFLNLEYYVPNEARMLEVARKVKPNSNDKSIKKELIELGQIVGGRLTSREGTPIKMFRGNHQPGTQTMSSSAIRRGEKPSPVQEARSAATSLAASTGEVKKKTAVKKKDGTSVRRAVVAA